MVGSAVRTFAVDFGPHSGPYVGFLIELSTTNRYAA